MERMSWWKVLRLTVVTSLVGFGASQPAGPAVAMLVADLEPAPGVPQAAAPHGLTAVGDRIFFAADDGFSGTELWSYDPGSGEAAQVADLCAGRCASNPHDFVAVGSIALFRASDPGRGAQLWRTDGTRAGTFPLHSFEGGWVARIGSDSAIFTIGYDFPSRLDPPRATRLMITDGTRAGTRLLVDLGRSVRQFLFVRSAGALTFLFGRDASDVWHLWRTDGTAQGTVALAAFPGNQSLFDPSPATVLAGRLYFFARDASFGSALWTSDGTAAGTHRVRAQGGSGLITAGNWLYFVDFFGQKNALWRSDGSAAGTLPILQAEPPSTFHTVGTAGAHLLVLRDTELWSTSANEAYTAERLASAVAAPRFAPLAAAEASDTRFFSATSPEGSDCQLWRSDGTVDGTGKVADLAVASACAVEMAGLPTGVLLDRGGSFAATSPAELWWAGKPAGSGLVELPPLHDGSISSSPTELTARRNELVFSATRDGRSELWRSDGTTAGSRLLATLGRASDLPGQPAIGQPVVLGARMLFIGDRQVDVDSQRQRLWSYDGHIVMPLTTAQAVDPLYRVGGRAFFFSAGASGGTGGLWTSDGTPSGTSEVMSFAAAACSRCDALAAAAGGRFVFALRDDPDNALWVSDGTAAGTRPILPWGTNGEVSAVIGASTRAYVLMQRAPFAGAGLETEWWRTDGTVAGTMRVANLGQGPVDIQHFATVGDTLFFTRGSSVYEAPDFRPTEELWRIADGVPGATFVATTDRAAPIHSTTELAAAGGRLYFTADDGVHGRELWSSDGTPAGTGMLRDIRPGPESSFPQHLRGIGGRLYFAADNGVRGLEVWSSAGTKSSTRFLADVAPGPSSSEPREFVRIGRWIYFSAGRPDVGYELWKVPSLPDPR